MNFTINQYIALNELIARGELTVSDGARTITYRSLEELLALLRTMEVELAPAIASGKS